MLLCIPFLYCVKHDMVAAGLVIIFVFNASMEMVAEVVRLRIVCLRCNFFLNVLFFVRLFIIGTPRVSHTTCTTRASLLSTFV